MRSNNESGGHNEWIRFIVRGLILIALGIIVVRCAGSIFDPDAGMYENDCSIFDHKEDFTGALVNNHIDIDNLQPVELPEADSMTLTFQFEFPFMFSIPDKAEILVYLPWEGDYKALLYAEPLPEDHKITIRVPKIRNYPAQYHWEFWLISRSELTVCQWNREDETLDFMNENAPHNYRVKLLTDTYGESPYDLRTTIFTPM